MSAQNFYIRIVKVLDEIDAPYMIVGAFAGLSFGIKRATTDVDLIVDFKPHHAKLLSARFPSPRYAADPEMVSNAVQQKLKFQLTDTTDGVKADMVPLVRAPEYRRAFSRRVRRQVTDETGAAFGVWTAQPTDIIIGKLQAWTRDHSNKQAMEIQQMLVFALKGHGNQPIEFDFVTGETARMSKETTVLWQELVERATNEVEKK